MAGFFIHAQVDGTDYGDVSGPGSTGESVIREVSFGPFASGSGPNHFDIRNITISSAAYGAGDIWAPALSGLGNFDAFYGSGADPTFSGGVMAFNNTADRYGVKDLGADYDTIYVQFDLRVYADNNDPDYHDIGQAGDGAGGGFADGIYDSVTSWVFDGPGNDFGGGAARDGSTWQTIRLFWSYAATLFADFNASPTTGGAPLAVFFTDTSVAGPGGPITGWAWDFGDGNTSTLQNDVNFYSAPGTYTATLTITSPDGTDTRSVTINVVVGININPASGCNGTVVTVTGSSFTPSSPLTVTFDGTPVTFSAATTDPSGSFSGTFTVPGGTGNGFFVVAATDGASIFGSAQFHIGPDLQGSPQVNTISGPVVQGSHGDTITLRGTCFCGSTVASVTAYLNSALPAIPIAVSNYTIDGAGNWTASFDIPETFVSGGNYLIQVRDGCGFLINMDTYLAICDRAAVADYEFVQANGIPGPFGVTLPPRRPNTATVPGPEITDMSATLDWIDHGDSYWVLFLRNQSDWSGGTFPPPAFDTIYPLIVYRFPKDGSPVTTYPVGGDLAMSWDFASKFVSTPGCFGLQQIGGVNCTPGATGYWWRQVWWFAGWRKKVLNARFASDGTNLWVGAIASETEIYPWISSDDGDNSMVCDFTHAPALPMRILSQAEQFVTLDTVTAGFTSFATSAATAAPIDPPLGCNLTLANFSDYQKWAKWGTGIFFFGAHRAPDSDGGDNWTGYYQQPKLVMFSFDGSAFNRIGDIPSPYVVGINNGGYNEDTFIGAMSLAASAAEPGVCHAVWSEMGSYGRRGAAGDNPISSSGVYEVWDGSEEQQIPGSAPWISSRINYSRWDSAGMTLQNDIYSGTQNRDNWYWIETDGFGDFTPRDSGPPPGLNYSDLFEVKNDHGSPVLLLSFKNVRGRTSADLPFQVSSGTVYDFYQYEDTVRLIDLSSGSAVQLATLDPTMLPSIADLDARSAALGGGPVAGPVSVLISGFSNSALYHDPLLNDDVYVVAVEFSVTDATGITNVGTFGVYKIRPDGSSGFLYIDPERDYSLAPSPSFPTSGGLPFGPPTTTGLPNFAIEPNALWMPTGHVSSFSGDGYTRLDLGPCRRWWELYAQNNITQALNHGPPILDPAGNGLNEPLLYYPGYVTSFFGPTVFGITAAAIQTQSCACPTSGIHAILRWGKKR